MHISFLFFLFFGLFSSFIFANELTDFLDSGRTHAVHLSPTNWGQTDSNTLTFLDKHIEGKRVIFLGEASHWVSEKYDYRLVLLQYLVQKGYRTIGMEMGLSDGARINQFLQTGDASHLNRLALYGYRNSFIRGRRSVIHCDDKDKATPEFSRRFKIEEMNFYSELYKIGVKSGVRDSIHHFGFDVDTVPGGGYEDLQQILAGHKSPETISLLHTLTLVENESLEAEILRLKKSLSAVNEYKSQFTVELGEKQYKKLRLTLVTLLSSFKFIAVLSSKPCNPAQISEWSKKLMIAMAEREKVMFMIFEAKLEELAPDEKIVLMGHDFHLSKDPLSLWFAAADIPAPYAPQMWPSIGQHIDSHLDLPIFSIWMIHNKGTQSNINCPTISCPVDSGVGYLGETFAQLGEAYLLPLFLMPSGALKYLDQRLNFSANGGTHSGNIRRNADMIFFVNEVTGLRDNRKSN